MKNQKSSTTQIDSIVVCRLLSPTSRTPNARTVPQYAQFNRRGLEGVGRPLAALTTGTPRRPADGSGGVVELKKALPDCEILGARDRPAIEGTGAVIGAPVENQGYVELRNGDEALVRIKASAADRLYQSPIALARGQELQ